MPPEKQSKPADALLDPYVEGTLSADDTGDVDVLGVPVEEDGNADTTLLEQKKADARAHFSTYWVSFTTDADSLVRKLLRAAGLEPPL